MWPNPQLPVDLVTFTEENLNGKLHFLCSVKKNTHQDRGYDEVKSSVLTYVIVNKYLHQKSEFPSLYLLVINDLRTIIYQ